MLRKLTMIFAVALLPLLASAAGVTAGTIQVSGGANLSALTGTQEVTISRPFQPDVTQKTDHTNYDLEGGALYYVTPMIGVGLDLGYESNAQEYKYSAEKETWTDLFIGPKVGLDLPLAEKLSFFGDLAVGLVRHSYEYEDLTNSLNNEKGDGSGLGFRIAAGVKYFVIPAISIDASLRYRHLAYSYDLPGRSYDVKDSDFGLVVGLSGYFGGSK